MARIIEFHIPDNYRPKGKFAPAMSRGQLIQFPEKPIKQSA
jgi:hypothetical protein